MVGSIGVDKMSQLYDRVMMSVTGTPGTGTITLGSAVLDGLNGDRLTFAQASIPTGTTVSYVVVDGHNWGRGRGIYTSAGTTLSRDAAEMTWNGTSVGNTPISLTSSAVVFLDAIAADLPQFIRKVGTGASNTISFTSLPAGQSLRLVCKFRSTAAVSNTSGLIQFNADTTAANYIGERTYSIQTTAPATARDSGNQGISFDSPGASNTAHVTTFFEMEIPNIADGTQKNGNHKYNLRFSGGDSTFSGSWYWASTAAITRIDIVAASGNWDSDTYASLIGLPW
jgi:hypothetical protein